MTRRGKLKQFAESVEPGVVVVEPWILRRIIRLDGRVLGFGQLLSRRETYPIERNRLLALVDSRELGVTSPGSMPERLVVLAEPEDLDVADTGGAEESCPASGSPAVSCLRASGAGEALRAPARGRASRGASAASSWAKPCLRRSTRSCSRTIGCSPGRATSTCMWSLSRRTWR